MKTERRPRTIGAREAIVGDVGDGPPAVRLRDGLLYCLKVFLAMRIGLSIIALFAVAIFPHAPVNGQAPSGFILPLPVDVPGWPAHEITAGWHNIATAWERFDALWYLRIAVHGYANHDGSAAFFPLYPMLVRGVSSVLGGHPLAAALLVSNAAFFGALLVLYALTARELSEEVARRAVVYAAVFPTSFFFLAPYSESLFLLLVLLMFWWARGGRWTLAALAAFLAALTRNLGVLLALPLALESWLQARELRAARVEAASGPRAARRRPRIREVPEARRALAQGLAAAAAPVLGLGVYLWFWYRLSGDWVAALHQQANWDRVLENPVSTLAKGTHEAFRWIGIYPGGYHLMDWVVVVPVLVASVAVLVRLRATYGLYVWASLLAPLMFIFTGRPLMSLPRFALPLFPIFWVLGRWTKGRSGRHEAVLIASSAMLGILLILFVNWFYVF